VSRVHERSATDVGRFLPTIRTRHIKRDIQCGSPPLAGFCLIQWFFADGTAVTRALNTKTVQLKKYIVFCEK